MPARRHPTFNLALQALAIRSFNNSSSVGHGDQRKTTLTSAVTKVLPEGGNTAPIDCAQIDKGPEEKARSIIINAADVLQTFFFR